MNLTFHKYLITSLLTVTACGLAWRVGNPALSPAQTRPDDSIVQFGDPARDGFTTSKGSTLLKGGSYAVRGLDEDLFDDNTKRVPYEIYRDEDLNTLFLVSENGGVAALPYRKSFQVKILGTGDGGFEIVRYSPNTGAAWRMINEKWIAIREAESDMPNAGEYDLQISDIGGAAVIVRLEHTSGATWLLNETEWVRVPETDSEFNR